MRAVLFAIAVVCLASPAESQVRTFYVSISGNNANPGSNVAPWRTLQRAANKVLAGDLVIGRPGNYTGFQLTTDGSAANPIEFRADAGVVINVPETVRNQHGINLEGADSTVVQGFTVTGMRRAGILAVVNHHVTIRGNLLDANVYWGVLTGFSDDVLIEDNETSRSQVEHGIYVSNSGDRPITRSGTIDRISGLYR